MRELIAEFDEFDENTPVADRSEIERYIPQRYQMAQLDAILLEDISRFRCVGYKDATENEFWVSGHMPGRPLMPGVIMCECAAQLSAYFTAKYNLMDTDVVAMGGMDQVRVRSPVVPGDRLIVMVQRIRVRPRAVIVCRFQGFVRQNLAVDGYIKGVTMPKGV